MFVIKMHRVMCFIVTALLILLQITCQNNEEVQFLCKNEECSESIGEFTVKLSYPSDSPEKISAKAKEKGIILAKPKDAGIKLWKVKIEDRIGFLPITHILETRPGEANTSVKLHIPTNSVLNSNSKTHNTFDPFKDVKQSSGINDIPITDNSSVPDVEKIGQESPPSVVDDSSNEETNADVDKNSNSTVESLKTDTTDGKISAPSSDESMKNESLKNQEPLAENKSLKNQEPLAENESLKNQEPLAADQILPDVSMKLENTSLEVNESEIVNVVKESENISDSSINIDRDSSKNLTQKIREEKKSIDIQVKNIPYVTPNIEKHNVFDEISNSSESISSSIETQNDTTSSLSDVKNTTQEENLPAENISTETNAPRDPSGNLVQNSEKAENDHVVSPLDEKQVFTEPSVESNLTTPNNTSLNSSAVFEVLNNFTAYVSKSSDEANPDLVPSIPSEAESSNETSTESNYEAPHFLPTPQSFTNEEPPVTSEKSQTSFEEIASAKELDNQHIRSEEINPAINVIHDHDPNKTENEHVTEVNQRHDSVTSKEIPKEAYPPHHIGTTTELPEETKEPIYTKESSDSNESVPTPVSTSSSSVAEDTPLSKLPEPYSYIKSSPYPGMLPNIVTENQPSSTEKSDVVSSQEIIETEPKTSSDSIDQTNESVSDESATFNDEQKRGLNDFIHSSRVKVNEDEPEPIHGSETSQGKSIYETVEEYLPDLSILSEKFASFFDFGSSSVKEIAENEVCSAEQFCGTDRLNSHMNKPENPESEDILEVPFLGVVSKEQVTFISGILTSAFIATILLWWLMNYFNKSRKTTLLVSRINQLENKLLISTREIKSLQDKLVEQDCQVELKQNAADTKRITEVYEHKINQYKKRIVELDDKVLYLEKELENVSNSALEMHKLLENSLANQAQSKSAFDEVETLRTLTENQESLIEELKTEINSVVTENECLKVDNEMNKSTIKKLEKECNAQTKKNVELSEKNHSLTLQLDKELENNTLLESNYKSEIYELRSKLEDVEMNFKRSEFQVQELQRAILDKQDSVPGSSNDVQLKIQISTLEAMNNELSGQLNEQKNARRMLEDHVGDITKELNNLKKSFENSEKERNQAVTKLQVLTQYFKDKEEQLHKELEAKDKLSLERESIDQSLSHKLSIMREEISNLRTQNEELRKEILDQEASFKVQLTNAEQKTREHWFALRQAERKYKESQQEAANLRNKILVLETNMSSISLKADDKNNSGLNGDIPSSSSLLYHPSLSPDLLPYPSPSDFIPPPPSPIPSHSPDFFPPEPIYSPDERLPPLGGRRGPSPPPPISPDDDFSPPAPVMKFPPNRSHNVEPPVPGGYSRRTPPPSGRHRSQFKSRPPRSSIDSPSSGMSLESLDKSGR